MHYYVLRDIVYQLWCKCETKRHALVKPAVVRTIVFTMAHGIV
jgi:hypothetical protein